MWLQDLERLTLPVDEDTASAVDAPAADPLRIRCVVGDLALALGVTEGRVTYALRRLRTAGLVRARKQGRVVFNRLADDFPEALGQHCVSQLSRDAIEDETDTPRT